VRRWMRVTDPEVRGAIHTLLRDSAVHQRITPPLCFDEVFDWILQYYEWCLRTDPRGECYDTQWVDTRWDAAFELIPWFIWWWDEGIDRSYLERVKAMLAELYISGSHDLREAIAVGLLEHLFERKPIREFFAAWKDDPQLRPAYEAASAWALGGGRIPLTRRRRRKRGTA
jgi:hypothetical protein